MAQRILGLDVGAHSVTVAILESTLRSTKATVLDVEPIKASEAPKAAELSDDEETRVIANVDHEQNRREAVKAALTTLQSRGSLEADHVVTAVPGDQVFTRILNFPFTDDKRIKQVIGFELENFIPHDIDDVIIDYHTLSTGPDGATVFAAAVPRAALDDFLGLLEEVGIGPRIVSLGTFAYTKLIETAHAQKLTSKEKTCFAVVDIGSKRTDITVTRDGKLAFARTIRRGADHVIRQLAEELNISTEQARRVLVTQGRILSSTERASLEASKDDDVALTSLRISDAIATGLSPILRDINQTLRSHERLNDTPAEQLYLAGGFANLRGLSTAVHAGLEIPTELFADLPGRVVQKNLSQDESVAYAEAIGLALELVRGGSRESVNFRRGSYSYQGDFQYLAERSPALLLCFSLILGLSVALFMTHKSGLTQQRDRLKNSLGNLTQEVLKTRVEDAGQAEQAMKFKPNSKFKKALPNFSSVWVLRQVSASVSEVRNTPSPAGMIPPEPDKKPEEEEDFLKIPNGSGSFYDVEIETFDHNGTKGELHGQANSLEARALFVEKLRTRDCFTDLEPKSDEVIRFSRHRGWRKFILNFKLDCKKQSKKDVEKDVEKDVKKEVGKAKTGASPTPQPTPDQPALDGFKKKAAPPGNRALPPPGSPAPMGVSRYRAPARLPRGGTP